GGGGWGGGRAVGGGRGPQRGQKTGRGGGERAGPPAIPTAASVTPATASAARLIASTSCHCERAFSPIQFMIMSAICRLFLSIISIWLLPFWPASGSSRNLALPPADLIAF